MAFASSHPIDSAARSATGRHRRDGRCPSGNSRNRKAYVRKGMKLIHWLVRRAHDVPGNEPGFVRSP
jgi:hypothetical protein